MITLTVQIGNSDDRLGQREWSAFCEETGAALSSAPSARLHFHGFAPGGAPWQNACWVLAVAPEDVPDLKTRLAAVGRAFRQDAVALTAGTTEML